VEFEPVKLAAEGAAHADELREFEGLKPAILDLGSNQLVDGVEAAC
jgi:hypothetical protein